MGNKEPFINRFFLFGLVLLFTHCNQADNESVSVLKTTESGLTTITGFVHNRDMFPNTRDITIYVSHISGRQRVTQIRTPLNDDGTFLFYIDLARPQDVTMQTFIDFLYLIPGDSLHVELDFANLMDVRLSGGKSADINNDFIRYFNATGYRTIQSNYSIGTTMIREGSWEEIMEALNAQRDEFRNRRERFLQNNDVHDEVLYLTEAMIELNYYLALANIVTRRPYERETIDKNLLMSKMNDVAERFFHSGFYSNAHFEFIRGGYVHIAALVSAYPNSIDDFPIWRNEVDFAAWAEKVAVNDVIRNFMLTTRAGTALRERDLERFGAVAQHISYDYLLDRVMQDFRITRMNMHNPELISSYILHGGTREFTLNLTLNNSPLDNLMRDRGEGNVQVISINAWWCKHCRLTLPLYPPLMRKFADKNVTFTFLQFEDSPESRNLYINSGIPLSLVHFTNDAEVVGYFFQTFTPFSFPYGILINRNGVIVDFGGHVRPGTRLEENINLLLRQDNLVR